LSLKLAVKKGGNSSYKLVNSIFLFRTQTV
jgi:hypothetical protein